MDFSGEFSYYQNYKEKFIDFYERALMGDTEILIFSGIMGCLWIMFAWDLYLTLRQRKIIKESTNRSSEFLSIMNPVNFEKYRSYELDRNSYNIFYSWYLMLEITIIFLLDAFPWLWTFTLKITSQFVEEQSIFAIEDDFLEEHEMINSLIFLIFITTFSFIDELPWKIYNKFYLETKHGITTNSLKILLTDQIRSFICTLFLVLPISYCLLYIIKLGGPYFYLHAGSFSFLMMTLFRIVYPEFISPLFENYVPLNNVTLKANIENLAESIGFPLKNIFVYQGLKRSDHNNIHFSGFWNNKHIVICDSLFINNTFSLSNDKSNITLIGDQIIDTNSNFTDQEILALLSHEFGHWKSKHYFQKTIIGQMNIFFMFYIFGCLINYGTLFKIFGFNEVGTPSLIKLVLIFYFIFSPYNALLDISMTLFSRQNEFQADKFTAEIGKGEDLTKALIKLQNNNLAFPIFDKWYSLFNYSHPPISERIQFIRNLLNEKV